MCVDRVFKPRYTLVETAIGRYIVEQILPLSLITNTFTLRNNRTRPVCHQ